MIKLPRQSWYFILSHKIVVSLCRSYGATSTKYHCIQILLIDIEPSRSFPSPSLVLFDLVCYHVKVHVNYIYIGGAESAKYEIRHEILKQRVSRGLADQSAPNWAGQESGKPASKLAVTSHTRMKPR